MHQLSTPEQLFSALLRDDPGRPFVSYYDEATGERSELSRKSLANWVAKTYHLLQDELGLIGGDRVLIALPAHWISVPAVLGALAAGLELTDRDTAPDPDAAFVEPVQLPDGLSAPDVFAVNPAAAAIGFRDDPPPGTRDYVTSVRPQPDAWTSVQLLADPSAPCLDGRTRAEAIELARARAAELGATDGARLLSTRDWTGPSDWVDTLLVPLVTGGSVVFVRNAPDEATVDRRIAQERATVRL